MDDYLISLFIDDELEFAEKLAFVRAIREDERFARETLAMLSLEERLRAVPEHLTDVLPERLLVQMEARPKLQLFTRPFSGWLGSAAGFAAALLLVALVSLFLSPVRQDRGPVMENHRFVLYHPESGEAKLVGSFTGWKPVAMERVGDNGYWSITLPLPPGEYRYSFMLGDSAPIPDPSISSREADDFGGENSVITVGRANEPLS